MIELLQSDLLGSLICKHLMTNGGSCHLLCGDSNNRYNRWWRAKTSEKNANSEEVMLAGRNIGMVSSDT